MHFLRRTASILAVLAIEGIAVMTVHRLGHRAPFDLPFDQLDPWLRASPEDALAAALRGVAMLCACWLLVATLAYAGASALRVPAAMRACEWATPSAIRRAVDYSFAASIVFGTVITPFGARALAANATAPAPGAPPSSVIVDVRDGRSLESLPAETTPPPVPPTAPPELPDPASAVASAPDAPVPVVPVPVVPVPVVPVELVRAVPVTVVVADGDNLWDLSVAALARATGRAVDALGDDEIGRYWRAVCDANRSALRSGDVNLIYPDEVVVLPPV